MRNNKDPIFFWEIELPVNIDEILIDKKEDGDECVDGKQPDAVDE